MTVEVLLMNSAVAAMAADSAVSIRSSDNGRLITQTEATKAFVLNPDAGCGMMTFGLAEFSGCPWTTVVDTFRSRGHGKEPSLAATADAFAAHLASLADTDLVSPASGDLLFRILAAQTLVELHRRYRSLLDGAATKPEDALATALERLIHEVEFETWLVEGVQKTAPRPRIGAETPRLKAIIDKQLDQVVGQAVTELFEPARRSPDLRAQMARLVRIGLLTDWMPPAADYAGIVIAGFGAKDDAPSYVELHVVGLVGDLVKYRVAAHERVGPDNPVVIRAFAQNGAVERFLHGADQDFVRAALRRTYGFAHDGVTAASVQAGLNLTEAGAIWTLVEEAVFRASLFGLLATRDAWRSEIEDTFGQKVRTASLEPMGRLAGQLLGLPLLESDMIGNTTVARPFSILRLSKAGARLDSQMEIG